MKTIIMLSLVLLTTVSAFSQARDGSGNKRGNGNTSSSSKAVIQSNRKTSDNHTNQSIARTNRSGSSERRSGNSVSMKTDRKQVNSNVSDNRKNSNPVVVANGSRSRTNNEGFDRRERTTSNQNDRIRNSERNTNGYSVRNADRDNISRPNYISASKSNHSDFKHFDNDNYSSHHIRIEHWDARHNDRFHHFEPLSFRRVRFPFLMPHLACLVWSLELRNEYLMLYPEFRLREYNYGYRLPMVSAYDASQYIGEIATIYGDVIETEYSVENDEYYLYIGQNFPEQDFSIVLPGNVARRFASWPESYFQGSHVTVSGLITTYNNKPEIIVKRANQIERYFR